MKVRLNGSAIADIDTFHTECQRALGFPAFYGRNMDAWIDCMSYLHDDAGMVGFRLAPDEGLELEVAGADGVRDRAPEVLEALVECTDFVNRRSIAAEVPAAIVLTFSQS